MERYGTTVTKRVLRGELKHEGVVVVNYRVEYPEFKGNTYQLALAGINKFYRTMAEEYKHYLENDFYDMAVKQ